MAAQLPDIIILDGEEMNLYSNPLEQYWTKLDKKRPQFLTSSVCTRGYVARWHLKNKELVLLEIDGKIEKRRFLRGPKIVNYSLKNLFGSSREIKADWYSGKLRIPEGKMTMYVNTNYDSRFEKEVIVTVDQGNVQKAVTLDFTQRTLIVDGETR